MNQQGTRSSIGYFVSTLEQAGAQVGMVRLLDGLDPEVYDVTVVAVKRGDHDVELEIPSEFPVLVLEDYPTLSPTAVRDVWRTVRDVDVLVCSLYHCTIVGRLLGTAARTPVVLNWAHNESFQNGVRKAVNIGTAPLSDAILADSPAVYETFVEEYSVPASQVRMVPIAGIDTDEYAPMDAMTPADEVHVGTLGRLTPQKNHVQVLKTAAVLEERNTDETYVFNVAGAGPLEDRLRSLRDKWGLENVRFHGFVDDVPAFLNSNDVYFQPSWHEGLCITVLEAMACGLPVVGSDTGGIRTSVDHERTGYLADPADTDAFVTYIENLSVSDRRNAFGVRGRDRVTERYSQQALVTAFEAVLEEFTESDRSDRITVARTD